MKEYVVTWEETVTYKTVIEAESIEQAREEFMEGNWNDCDEYNREMGDIVDIEED